MNKLEKLEKVDALLREAWLLAYKVREEGGNEFEGALYRLRMAINNAQLECNESIKEEKLQQVFKK